MLGLSNFLAKLYYICFYMKSKVGAVNWFKPCSKTLYFFCGSFYVFFCPVFVMSLCASVYWCLVVTCLERADHLDLVCGV